LLNPKEKELVALGAAMGSNCVPCVEYHVPEARKAGFSDAQIAEAIHYADKVRQVPARKVLEVAMQLVGEAPAASPSDERHPCEGVAAGATSGGSGGGCGCG
jgi:4-carboxymuconolactone decarboxylase